MVEKSDPIMETLTTILATMTTKSDLDSFKINIETSTKIIVSEAVDPIKDEVVDIKSRIQKLEEAPWGGRKYRKVPKAN